MKYKSSRQRDAVMELLDKEDYHPTVDEIYAIIKKDFPRISLATVYRNVEQLCRMDKVWKLESGAGPARYDGNMIPHKHITCEKCGEVKDVWLDDEVLKYVDAHSDIPFYTVTRVNLSFTGICDKCNTIN